MIRFLQYSRPKTEVPSDTDLQNAARGGDKNIADGPRVAH